MSSKLWGGRFSTRMDPIMERFNASIGFDKRLFEADLKGSRVYAMALRQAGLLTENECKKINDALLIIENEWKANAFEIKPGDEDIHTANERRLKELIGESIGGKLHTGRSRNDQVATDVRLWMKESMNHLKKLTLDLIQVITLRAEKEIEVIMPGYTHLQRAQPVLWSHWLLSYAWMLKDDFERLQNVLWRTDVCPLGSGAIAGNPFEINRDFITKQLSFRESSSNSMHAVADRDFVAEFQFWASLTATHLSRLAEDLIIFSTKEFGFVTLSDAYSTGSSLMPQKKNADSLELIRGKSARILGNCTAILTLLKGIPSTFNKDLQEDKEKLFDTYDTISDVIKVATGTVETLTLNCEECKKALSTDMLATDLAYFLVRKGLPFRNAHETAGKVVSVAEQLKCDILNVPFDTLKNISELFTEDVKSICDFGSSVEQYKSKGGTATSSVNLQIFDMKQWIARQRTDK
ncbi:argininosuccinate lyase-like protein [Dinothrombium tinctorium]|uniref:Argininosuccinate lyase-like protein n=1 Tax=Dinothrombium tinctorium TaxID=1965070 RepID=A0A3S3PG63_9ACAR|nr:argininosuccinate lyase-like protein [Dinothrombium tinctorium]